MEDSTLVFLCDREEAAHHEAGHAVIELVNGYSPQLLVLRPTTGRWEGECYSCAPTDSSVAGWRAQQAVAGVLAQARFVAEKSVGTAPTLEGNAESLVDFFLTEPTPHSSCSVSWRGSGTGSVIAIDLGKGYSSEDYSHFRAYVCDLAAKVVGHKCQGHEAECRVAAANAVAECISLISKPVHWDRIKRLAGIVLKTDPVTVHAAKRDDIERA